MMTLVTGASGFVGSHLVEELLERGEPVRALVRDAAKAAELEERGVEVVVGDIRDVQTLEKAVANVNVVQHCAAAVGPGFSRQEFYDTNLIGTGRLFEAVRKFGGNARVVLVSSINVLGTCHLDPATEDMPYRYSNDPAADVKIEAEKLAYTQFMCGLDVTIVRPGFIYGPGDHHNLPKLMNAIASGKFSYIGRRNNVVPIIHVSDVVEALLLAGTARQARGRVYNVTDGSRTTIAELVEHLADLLGAPRPDRLMSYFVPYLACVVFGVVAPLMKKPAPINRATLRFLGKSRYVEIARARSELGFEPRISLRDGMAATEPWIQECLEEVTRAATLSA